MLFYVKCPSCSRIISKNLSKYYAELNDIRQNHTMTKKEKEDKSSKLLDKYGITNICCRSRVISTPPYHEIVIT